MAWFYPNSEGDFPHPGINKDIILSRFWQFNDTVLRRMVAFLVEDV
ncbi:hypothetical protein NG798_17415 [Ancylothrix sp. C2]|nr:hypothetical protein [Ancylothrix sp. D3o]MCT7951586.1 hypothetical protein [Ancylothrix sp. D3o]